MSQDLWILDNLGDTLLFTGNKTVQYLSIYEDMKKSTGSLLISRKSSQRSMNIRLVKSMMKKIKDLQHQEVNQLPLAENG